MSTDNYDWNHHWATFETGTQANPAQSYRFRLILKYLKRLNAPRIVDVGCGQGDLLAAISKSLPQSELFGFELSEEGVAKTLSKTPSAQVEVANLLDSSSVELLQCVQADVATCSEVLEHVEFPDVFLARAALALKANGRLIVTVPGGPITEFDRSIGHLRHFSLDEICQLLEKSGFEVEIRNAAGFPFFNFYKLMVKLRGSKVASDYQGDTSLLFRTVMRVFGILFRLNLSRFLGWQNFVVARNVNNIKRTGS